MSIAAAVPKPHIPSLTIRRTLPIAAAVLAGLLWVTLQPAPARAQFGELTMIRGASTLIRGRITARVVGTFQLERGDRIRTGAGARAHVRLLGPLAGSEALVTENTEFAVNDLVPTEQTSPFELLAGAIRSRLLSFTRDVPYMRTPTATVGVKGTDFIIYVPRSDATQFIGIDGLIEGRSLSVPDAAIRLGKRQWGEIVENQPPKEPIRVPDDIWAAAQAEFAFPGETGFGPSGQ